MIVLAWLWSNPLARMAVSIVGGVITGAVIIIAILRNDRAKQQYRERVRDYERAEDLRRRADAVRADGVRSANIRYRD